MTEKILFFFAALGVFNAILLAIYFLVLKTGKEQRDYLLGGLLLCLSVRIGVSCLYFFEVVSPLVIKVGLGANLMLGPIVMFLVGSYVVDKEKSRQLFIHLGVWIVLFLLALILFDFKIWDHQIRYFIHFVLTAYLIFIPMRWSSMFVNYLKQGSAEVKQEAVVIYLAVVGICLGFVLSLFSTYILGPLVFSLIFYCAIGYFIISKKVERKYRQSPNIGEPEFQMIHRKLVALMRDQKLYQDPDLSLSSLADRLNIRKHLLSQVLNEKLGKNFYQYVNEFRIEEACALLQRNNHFSMEAIGHEVGFHSRSTFFTYFKKLKGMTPAQFRAQL